MLRPRYRSRGNAVAEIKQSEYNDHYDVTTVAGGGVCEDELVGAKKSRWV
jgi:hypothetical protein